MSSNKPKDEAERLVRVVVFPSGTSAELWVDEQNILKHARPEVAEAKANVIRTTIRRAIEGRDRIMTDLLSESEAFHEGWRQGAAAMQRNMADELYHWSRNAEIEPADQSCYRVAADDIIGSPIPFPPSHDDSGEPLTPSPVHLRAQRMECFIKRLIRDSRAFGGEQPMASIAREAREALEDSTNE